VDKVHWPRGCAGLGLTERACACVCVFASQASILIGPLDAVSEASFHTLLTDSMRNFNAAAAMPGVLPSKVQVVRAAQYNLRHCKGRHVASALRPQTILLLATHRLLERGHFCSWQDRGGQREEAAVPSRPALSLLLAEIANQMTSISLNVRSVFVSVSKVAKCAVLTPFYGKKKLKIGVDTFKRPSGCIRGTRISIE